MIKYVYEFSEGDKDEKDLLGGKDANLAEMTNLGLPVPPGFTITTQACREYLREGRESGALRVQVTAAMRHLEDSTGRRLGDRHDPLLVGVRSGAKFAMPGMMATVLNIGLNDASVMGRAEAGGDERFASDRTAGGRARGGHRVSAGRAGGPGGRAGHRLPRLAGTAVPARRGRACEATIEHRMTTQKATRRRRSRIVQGRPSGSAAR